jgi:acyl transferase domain-containing protein
MLIFIYCFKAYYMTGTSLSITANRINYVLDLLGPSTIVDTACSSTLTAMHIAVQAIRNGDCDQAVVAGVNLIASPPDTVAFSQLGVLSPDGVSKSFDNDADGYARADSGGKIPCLSISSITCMTRVCSFSRSRGDQTT